MTERPLTPKQVLAINHITTGCCRTYTSCAQHVGVGRHTISKWARQTQFQEAIDRASQDERKKVAKDVLETALQLGGPALQEEMHNAIQDPSVP